MTLATSEAGVSVLESIRPIWSAGHNWKDAIRNCELIPPGNVQKSMWDIGTVFVAVTD
jgi:hypothetical protein